MMAPLLLHGMLGLGDCLHERAIIRQYQVKGFDVWLESPWVSVFHDLIPLGLKVIRRPTSLRTQSKNSSRELADFSRVAPPQHVRKIRIWYSPDGVRGKGSVLGAICDATQCDIAQADFRLPVPPAWRVKAQAWIDKWRPTKPIMIYRPLVDRTEAAPMCAVRNPAHDNYATLFKEINDRFFVVSVADLVPRKEWMVGKDVRVDARCHSGELEFETLAALFSMSALVFTSPGFAVPLAQAVETPVVCVFGGYENSKSFAGTKFSPYLGIDTIKPCDCFCHNHRCNKVIDLPLAIKLIREFASDSTRGPDGIPEYCLPEDEPSVRYIGNR